MDTMTKEEEALHRAVRNRHRDIVEYLLRKGVKASAKTFLGENTPLHKLAKEGDEEAVSLAKMLIDLGKADINATNSKDETPLHVAANQGTLDFMEFLISRGANVDARNEHYEKPRHVLMNQYDTKDGEGKDMCHRLRVLEK